MLLGGESSKLLICQLQMVGYWPTFAETEHIIRVLFWRVRLEKRLALLRKAAAAHHCPILTQGQENDDTGHPCVVIGRRDKLEPLQDSAVEGESGPNSRGKSNSNSEVF